ncbi:MAG: aspartate ammonia-lyase [Clostridiales bacterium]|nr:aspartate ammonia-lyase [Clostridiales bacterium]
MTNTRTEKDFLGTKEVPTEVYYGIQTLRAKENFPITGYTIHPALIAAMAQVKKAAALANAETGFLDAARANAIAYAADEILAGRCHDQFIVDPIQGGAGTSINMNTNEVIANLALEKLGKAKGDYKALSPNSHVNMSQSTNDAVPTAAHLALYALTQELLAAMQDLQDGYLAKAKEFDAILKMGRTHLQDAVPIRFGQELTAYARVLGRDIARIRACGEAFLEVNMGATAVGTGLNADENYIKTVIEKLRQISGFPVYLAEDLVDATQNTDCFTALSAALKTCMISQSKIMNDLRISASGPRCGINEINLPPRQPGSSIMPGKVNPVMAEVVNQTAFQVIGNDLTITLAAEAGQFELNVMEPALLYNLIQSLCIMTNAFRVFLTHCLSGLTVNADRMRANVEGSVGIITAINPYVGYETASQIAREATLTGQTVRDLCLAKGVLTAAQLDKILDPYAMTRVGTVERV